MEQDAAPAGGRRTRLPKHPGRARCPARRPLRAARAGRRLRGAAVTACPQTAFRKAQPGAASSVYDCGRSGMKTTANEPGQRCPGGAPGGASASSQGDADTQPTTAAPPGAPSPRIRRGEKKDGAPGAAKKQGGEALPIDVPGLSDK